MAVEDIIQPTREVSFSYKTDKKEEEFIIREPSPDEMNMCDIFRSKIWYDCMKKGIPTEEEILDMLKNQGRFNPEKFQLKLDELNNLTSESLQKMAMAESLEELEDSYKEAAKNRENSLTHLKKKSAFTRHSVEVRADHAYNMALMGVCVEKRNGTPVFAVNDELGNLDIEKTFERTENWKDIGFINAALSHFLPFIMGFADGQTKYAEDFVYDTISLRFKKNEESENPRVELSDEKHEEIGQASLEATSAFNPPKEEVKPKEEAKVEIPEVTIEAPKVEHEPDPFDMEDSPTEEIVEEPKKELPRANNRPKMSPAPTADRMTVKGGQRAAEEEVQIDPTVERAGFRTGDEDASYGDGSASPGGAPMRTILKRD